MASITSANAVLMLTVNNLFPVPQQLQGFSADDIFDSPSVVVAESLMGVDGVLSAGHVNNPVEQTIMFQADSLSNYIFETWANSTTGYQELYFGSMTVLFPALSRKYFMPYGTLLEYTAIPSAGKTLKPRQVKLVWQKVIAGPG